MRFARVVDSDWAFAAIGGRIAFRRTFGRLKPSRDDLLSLHASSRVSCFFGANGADNLALKIKPPGAFGEIPLVVAAIAISLKAASMSLGSTSGMVAKMSALMSTFSGGFALLKFLNAPGYMRMSCRLRATTAAARCCLSDGGSVVG
jgi:hypothetical protein